VVGVVIGGYYVLLAGLCAQVSFSVCA